MVRGAGHSELRRDFGLSTLTYVVMSSMVGTGILTTSGYILLQTESATLLLLLWAVGGGLALCGALTVAELAAAMPRAGGEYVYIHEAYGVVPAFLYGWITYVIGFSAPTAITAYAAGRYLIEGCLAGSRPSEAMVITVAAAAVILFTFVHLRGHAFSARAQAVTTLIKIIVLAGLVVGAALWGRGDSANFRADLPEQGIPWAALAVSLVFVMFSYTGWNAATYLAGEVREASRLLPRSLILGCVGVAALYLMLNLVYVYGLSVDDVRALPDDQLNAIAAIAANHLFGPWIARPLSIAIGVGLLATVSAFVLTGPRVYYAMACEGLFPSAAARVDARTGTPNAAILAQTACTLVLLVSGRFEDILTYAGVGLSISSFFVILAVFVLRVRRPEMPRPFRTPGYPLVPLLFLSCTGWMIVFAFWNDPRWPTISLASILAGVPLYYLWRFGARRSRKQIS